MNLDPSNNQIDSNSDTPQNTPILNNQMGFQILSNILFNTNRSAPYVYQNSTETLNNPSTARIRTEAYLRLIEDLLQLPPMPMQEGGINFQDFMQQTLNQQNAFKHVLSEEGEKAIEKIKYDSNVHSDIKACPIMQMDFEEGEEVAQLPCGHIFNPEAILRWLKDEKAECPICRHKMPSFEKRIHPPTATPTTASTNIPNVDESNSTEENDDDDDSDMPELIDESENPVLNLNSIFSNNIQFAHPFGARNQNIRGRTHYFNNLIRTRQQMDEEEELQAALLASLEDQYMNPTKNNENKNNVENNTTNDYSDMDVDSDDEI